MPKLGRTGRPHQDELVTLEKITDWFLKIWESIRPDNISTSAWLEYLFHIKERSLDLYKAVNHFKIPGYYLEVPAVRYMGMGHRQVVPGDMLVVRHDTTEPDVYHISHTADGREHVFELTEFEWLRLRGYLERVDV